MFAIIRKWPVWVLISLIGIVAGQALFWTQMRLSIDFTGGIKTVFTTSASQEELTRDIATVVDTNPSWKMNSADASVETDGTMATALFVVDTESAEITSNDIVQ